MQILILIDELKNTSHQYRLRKTHQLSETPTFSNKQGPIEMPPIIWRSIDAQ